MSASLTPLSPKILQQWLCSDPMGVLIFDPRLPSLFNASAIIGAVHISIPTSLLKRQGFRFSDILGLLARTEMKLHFERRNVPNIKIIFAEQQASAPTPYLQQLLNKWQAEFSQTRPGEVFSECNFILEGGHEALATQFPTLITTEKLDVDILPQLARGVELVETPMAPIEMRGGPMPDQITEQIFLGDHLTATNLAGLQGLGITLIINATDIVPNFLEDGESFRYLRVPLKDTINQVISDEMVQQMLETVKAELDAGGKVLFHCFAGQSRSAAMVMAYLIHTRNWGMEQALTFCKEKRKVVNPNFGFLAQLYQMGVRHAVEVDGN